MCFGVGRGVTLHNVSLRYLLSFKDPVNRDRPGLMLGGCSVVDWSYKQLIFDRAPRKDL